MVTAVANGTDTVTATSGSASGTAAISVNQVGPRVTSVSPTNFTEGQSATLTGSGFSTTASSNTVRVDGLTATVTSASGTQLQITVPTAACMPSRETTLVVVVASDSVTRAVGVNPAYDYSLNVGGGLYTTSGGECLRLKAGSSSERYLVGVMSSSETATSLTAYTQSAIAGTALSGSEAAGAAMVVTPMSGDVAFFEGPELLLDAVPTAPPGITRPATDPEEEEIWRAHYEAEARRMEAYINDARIGDPQALMQSQIFQQRANAGSVTSGMQSQLLQQGENAGSVTSGMTTLSIRVPDATSSGYTEITAVVTHVGNSAIFFEDVANPYWAAGGISFTTAQYEAWDATLTNQTMPTIKSYFGDIGNVTGLGIENRLDLTDTNKIAVMITKEVNRSGAVGFVNATDLRAFSNSDPASDQAEIFYGLAPDPLGQYGTPRTRAWLLEEYPTLLAHETVHILQFTQDIHYGAASHERWEMEGGAALAEQLVGNAVLGHGGSGQNLGLTELLEGYGGDRWYKRWADDLVYYLGYETSTTKVDNPEQCTWLDTGIGPCVNGRSVYGPPATLLRMILDRHGPSYTGGETALMRALTSSTQSGFNNLTTTTGDSMGLLLTLFGMNLYADGRPSTGWNSSSFTSWDLYPILADFGAAGPVWPYTSSAAEPTTDLSVRAGSTAYLDWSPSSSHAPTAFRIRTQAGDDLPPEIVLWIFRIQ